MKPSGMFLILAGVYLAPRVTPWLGVTAGGIYLLLATICFIAEIKR